MFLKKILRALLPPLVFNLVRKKTRPVVEWGSPVASWEEAKRACTGYDAESVFKKVTDATRAVVSGRAVYERDSVLFDRIEYSWPLLASLLFVKCRRGSLHVVDFGGALGSTFRQNRKFLQPLEGVSWTVIEQERFVRLGKAEFETDRLKFASSLTEACSGNPPDVVLLASTLCYLEDPWSLLKSIEASGAPFLIIDRTPYGMEDKNSFRIQTVREPIYDATYPCQIFSKPAFESRMAEKWELIESWDTELQASQSFTHRGYLFARKS